MRTRVSFILLMITHVLTSKKLKMELEFITRFMLENFEQTTISSDGTHFLARCVLCGDSKKNRYKKRFNLNYNNGIPGWHCWNCGEHGNFITIYSIVKGLSYDEAKRELYSYNKKRVIKVMNTYKHRPNNREKVISSDNNFNFIRDKCYTNPFDIPTDVGLLHKRYLQSLRDFYESRKISRKYKIYICYSGRYKNRIILPIFNENKNIIYFQARRIPNTGITPKYDNPKAPKFLCILNKDRFDPNKNIIITEGLIDAFMIGDQGTSCLGKEISEKLIERLLKLTNKKIIVALDNDREAYKSLAKFFDKNKYAKKVKYFIYPQYFGDHTDINSYVMDQENDIDIYDLITENTVSYSNAYTKLSIYKMLEVKEKK